MPLKIKMTPVAQLVPYAANARTHSEQQITQIAASITEFGFTNPILTGADNIIIAGHGRLLAAQKLGIDKVPVIVLEHLDEAQRRALVIADNKLAENAGWDEELLRVELAALDDLDFDLDLTGFSDEELENLLGNPDLALGEAEGEDDIPEPPEDPVSRPGDLWLLGNHRLLCGDATVATDVERVLGNVKPLLMVTDPPYGVEYDPGWRNQTGGSATKRTGKVLNDDRADWREAWDLFPGDVAYVWHGALHAATVAESLEAAGFNVRSQIITRRIRLPEKRGHKSRAGSLKCRPDRPHGPSESRRGWLRNAHR